MSLSITDPLTGVSGARPLKGGGWANTRNAFDDGAWTSLPGHRYGVPAAPITEPRRHSVLEDLFFEAVRKRL